MKRILTIMAVILATIVILSCTGCSSMEIERGKSSRQIAKYQQTQPIPSLEFSNTRDAVIRRINR